MPKNEQTGKGTSASEKMADGRVATPRAMTRRTRRVSPCEPLCARLGAGVACVPAESCLPHTARDAGIVAHSGGGDGQHRICLVCGEAAALPNALGGQSPAPRFRAEAHTHF